MLANRSIVPTYITTMRETANRLYSWSRMNWDLYHLLHSGRVGDWAMLLLCWLTKCIELIIISSRIIRKIIGSVVGFPERAYLNLWLSVWCTGGDVGLGSFCTSCMCCCHYKMNIEDIYVKV